MSKLVILALCFLTFGSPTAGAAAKHRHVSKPHETERPPFGTRPAFTTRPAWAAPHQCFTDDGYGRFTPCEGGGKGY